MESAENIPLNNPSTSGGAAMAGGQRFQAQVTAWWAARVVLQTPVGQRFDLSAISIPERIYAETADAVDDIRIEFTDHGVLYGQCKRSLSLSMSTQSEWASVLVQFYKELERVGPNEIQRRFVLFYETYNGNLEKLSAVLNRYRLLPVGTVLLDATTNNEERTLVNNLNSLLDALQATPSLQGLAEKREKLLRTTYIKQLKLHSGDPDYLGIVDALQDGILTIPTQVIQTVTSLHRLADDLLAERGSIDRLTLRQRLQGEGIILRDSVSYRSDFEKLDAWSTTEIANHEAEKRARLTIGENEITIPRPVVEAMLEAVQKTSFIVVGGAGSGKTGCLLTLANQLLASGFRVWYWAADSLPGGSPQEIATQLQLQHPWAGLLAEAVSGVGVILIIDGLDGLRDTRAHRAYLKLLALATRSGIKVVVSIRSFDLLHSIELQELFGSAPKPLSEVFSDSNFRNIKHIVVPELSETELGQVMSRLPAVQTVLDNAPKLRPVIRNLFSLDLLCKLIASGDSAMQLSEISTQAELFERYWAKRIVSHPLHNEIEQALKQLIERMVNQQSLQITLDSWLGEVRDALFSAEIVRHPPSVPGRLPRHELIEFNHHLLFDYAAELLFIRSRRNTLATELTPHDNWGLFLRPSLILFFRYAWRNGRLDFWDILLEFERSSVPLLHRMPGHLVVAEEAFTQEDFQSTLEGAIANNADKPHWVQIIQGIVAAASFSSLPKLFTRGLGVWWVKYARDLILTNDSPSVYAGQRILFSASDTLEALSDESKHLFNEGAILLVQFHRDETDLPNDRIKPAIGWVCRSIRADVSASNEVIRSIISKEELQRAGYIQAFEITRHIKNIWQADPSLAVEVYDSIFSHLETARTTTSMGSSQIMPLLSNRIQDYEMNYYLLANDFPRFLSEHPQEATRALIRVMKHWRDQQDLIDGVVPILTFLWNGCECHIESENRYGSRWGRRFDEQDKIIGAWNHYLETLPSDEEANTKWETIAEVLCRENELAVVWIKLLEAARQSATFYTEYLWTILLNPTLLASSAIENEAGACIERFAPHLSDTSLRQIESVILGITHEHFPDSISETIDRQLAYTKARLLSSTPEERRGAATREFLDQCDPEILKYSKQRYNSGEIYGSSREIDWLAEEGVDVEHSVHKELLETSKSLNSLSANEIIDNNLDSILQNIRTVEHMLVESQGAIDERVNSSVQERIVEALSKVAFSNAKLDEEFKNELLRRFEGGLELPADIPSDERLKSFDHHPSWSPNQRRSSAEGWICLIAKEEILEPAYKEMLSRLAHDPDPVVRFFLGSRIWAFFKKWPEFVWETLESWIADLPTQRGSAGVLQGPLSYNGWLWWLWNENRDRANQLLRDFLIAAHSRNEAKFQIACGSWIAALWFSKGETWAYEILESFVTSLRDNLDELNGAQNSALSLLLPRTPKESRPEERQRALTFLVKLLNVANQVLEASKEEIESLSASGAEEDSFSWVRKIFEFFNHTAYEFQFSAEGHAKQWTSNEEAMTQLPERWNTVEPILDAIIALPHPGVVYHLIEGLEYLIPFDVQRGIHWLRKITLASVPQGLNVESLAADTTIKILEKTLAEHKFALASGDEMRIDFVQTLEAYLQVGWPKAMLLAIRLESIFR